MASESMKVQEMTQGAEGDDGEMFWMVLGEEGYADADFWRFRPRFENRVPKWYRVSASDKTAVSIRASHRTSVTYSIILQMQPIPAITTADFDRPAVYILNGIFELYVIVCKTARDRRDDIRLALDLAEVSFLRLTSQRSSADISFVFLAYVGFSRQGSKFPNPAACACCDPPD